MTKLFIDNLEADVDSLSEISISLSMASLTSTSWGRAGYSKSISIPATPHNRRLMGDCLHPLSAEMFNHRLHTARVEVDGCVILEGTVHLAASKLGADGYFRFNIIGNAREWVKAASESIAELLPDEQFDFTESAIRQGLQSGESLVKFFPVEHGGKVCDPLHHNRLLPDNYHPFINIGLLLRAIFAKAGYAVESEFMDSEFFRGLYMSGRWSEQNYEGWGEQMDFLAFRYDDSPSATADEFGRVHADPLANFSTVGNLVDLPDGQHGSFNRGCLSKDSTGRLCFTPTSPVWVAFEHRLRFRTDYRIKSRALLEGLSTIRPTFTDRVTVPIENGFTDLRKEPLLPNHTYTLLVFDLVEGAEYNLYAKVITNPNANLSNLKPTDFSERRLLSTTFREGTFSHSFTEPVLSPRLEMVLDGVSFTPLSDWAIYDGTVHEFGTTTVDVTLRSKAQMCSPTEPKFFDMFCFEGPEGPLEMTLLAGSSLRPIFIPHPAEGSRLSWREIMNYSFTGLDLLSALKELFDLQIYTDPLDRKVCIEPRSQWCDPRVIVDWSERVDLARGVAVEELGGNHPKELQLAYRPGDGAVAELEEQSGGEYATWSATIDNIFATEGCRRVENRLFTPSLSISGTLSGAPSAWLLRVGDKDTPSTRTLHYHNFLPKIVHYRGLRTLPFGQSLEYPSGLGSKYPLLTFCDDGSMGGEPSSLLFGPSEAGEGLECYWRDRVATLNHSRRITLYVALRPQEVEQIVVPNSTKHDFRAHYLVKIEGQPTLCRLEEIVDYNPEAPSTRLVLTTI